jgi:FMN phosphatase YigB (HAD superfamily)
MEVRALIFDLGNVIVRFDPEEVRSVFVRDHPERERLPAGDAAWQPQWDYECGRLSTAAFAQHVGELIGRQLSPEEFDAAWAPVFHLNESLAALIPALGEKYPLVLLSNTNDSHWRCLKEKFAATLRHFDACLLSFELGRPKPDPQVFLQAAAAAGQVPEHCLFVDDSERYVAAARAAGLQALRYTGAETEGFLRSLL